MGGTSVDRLPCHSQRKTDSKEPSPSFLMIANDCYEPMTHCQQTNIISQISMTTRHRIILHEFSWVLDGHWIERESSNDVSARQSDCRYFRIKPSKFKQPCDARVSWFELTNCIGSAGSSSSSLRGKSVEVVARFGTGAHGQWEVWDKNLMKFGTNRDANCKCRE